LVCHNLPALRVISFDYFSDDSENMDPSFSLSSPTQPSQLPTTFHRSLAPAYLASSPDLVASDFPSHHFPFHRLPPEVLIAIFLQVELSSYDYGPFGIPPPVILSHVCRLWRDIALDSATLWTDIRIYDDHAYYQSHRYYEMYFERSKSSPIDVSYYHFRTSLHATDAISHILLHITRIRRLTIMMTRYNKFFLSVMALFKQVSAPCLESFRLSLTYPYKADEGLKIGPMPLFTGGAALLRSVQLKGFPCLVQPQFTQLTSFTFRMPIYNMGPRLPQFLGILNNFTQTLIRLSVDLGSSDSGRNYPSFPCVELPLLESLRLSESDILHSLHTPRLRSLYMKNVDCRTFIKRCSSWELSTLESLQLDTLDLSYLSKTAVVRGLPLLTELMFWNCKYEDVFLSLLMEKDVGDVNQQASKNPSVMNLENSGMIPHLRSLTLSTKASWPLFQAIILDRIAEGIPIKHVRFQVQRREYNSVMREYWLTGKSIDCEWCVLDIEDPEDRLWLAQERNFHWIPEHSEETWSDDISDDSDFGEGSQKIELYERITQLGLIKAF
jgi:F-box-like